MEANKDENLMTIDVDIIGDVKPKSIDVFIVRKITNERTKSIKSPIEDLVDVASELYSFAVDSGWCEEPNELDAHEVIERVRAITNEDNDQLAEEIKNICMNMGEPERTQAVKDFILKIRSK